MQFRNSRWLLTDPITWKTRLSPPYANEVVKRLRCCPRKQFFKNNVPDICIVSIKNGYDVPLYMFLKENISDTHIVNSLRVLCHNEYSYLTLTMFIS